MKKCAWVPRGAASGGSGAAPRACALCGVEPAAAVEAPEEVGASPRWAALWTREAGKRASRDLRAYIRSIDPRRAEGAMSVKKKLNRRRNETRVFCCKLI
jgi:hypothetical protein